MTTVLIIDTDDGETFSFPDCYPSTDPEVGELVVLGSDNGVERIFSLDEISKVSFMVEV